MAEVNPIEALVKVWGLLADGGALSVSRAGALATLVDCLLPLPEHVHCPAERWAYTCLHKRPDF